MAENKTNRVWQNYLPTGIVDRVKDYFIDEKLNYDVLEIYKKSNHPDDDNLYMVIGKHKNTGEYTVWTSYNASTNSLNHGHYNIADIEKCHDIISENTNEFTEEELYKKEQDIIYVPSPFYVHYAYDTDGSILDAPTELDLFEDTIHDKMMRLNSDNNLLTINANGLFYNITAINPETIEGDVYYSYNVDVSNGDKYNNIEFYQVKELINKQIDISVEQAEKIKSQQKEQNINDNSDKIKVSGHKGTWYVIDTLSLNDNNYYLLESELYGDEAPCLLVKENKEIIVDEVINGFSDLIEKLSSEELEAIIGSIEARIDYGSEIPDNEYNLYESAINERECRATRQQKQRLFVDMDGTLAQFNLVQFEDLLQQGYYENLKPIDNVLNAVKQIINKNPDIEVYILSAVLSESSYALEDKNKWLDKYLPEVDAKHRVFTPCTSDLDKKAFIPSGIRETDFLLDDYTKNLAKWQPPALGIKLLNGINHTNGTWQDDRISFTKAPSELANNIVEIMKGQAHYYDLPPQQYGTMTYDKLKEQTTVKGETVVYKEVTTDEFQNIILNSNEKIPYTAIKQEKMIVAYPESYTKDIENLINNNREQELKHEEPEQQQNKHKL